MRGRWLGVGAAASAVAMALLVSGCGSGGDGSDGGKDAGGDSSSATGSGGTGGGDKGEARPDDGGPGGAETGGSGGDDGAGGPGGTSGGGKQADLSPYLGPWAAGMKSDAGKPMILNFSKDGTVSLVAQDLACQGTLQAAEKPAKLRLECRDGEDRYTQGKITELNGESLTVTWATGKPMEFLKGADPAGPPGE